ncbi:hypothetical protein LCGC14_0463950 [marine sediment metagenome]|uniref:Uncharacterized protein n=1 Tax=marine sediment metagenome TaxID=412755 RepID=A0A0F9SX60_9ZZZZ
MATVITPANAAIVAAITGLTGLKIADVSESVTVSSNTEGESNTKNIGIAAEVTILDASDIETGGALDFDGVFVINKDDTNFVRLRLADTGAHTVDFKLDAGRFMFFWNTDISVSTTEGAFAAFTQIDTIIAQADTAPCDIQIVAFRI